MRARICLASAESVLLRSAGESLSGNDIVASVTAEASLPTGAADVDKASNSTRSLVASAAKSTEVREKKTLVNSLD